MTRGEAMQKASAIVGKPLLLFVGKDDQRQVLTYFAPVVEECSITEDGGRYHVEAQLYDYQTDRGFRCGLLPAALGGV